MTPAQLALLGEVPCQQIVNVASVPQRSPFRYPGGKTWLVPQIREWLGSLNEKPREFIEPFAGGGIVSLTVGFENLADKVAMIELDEDIAAVWETILSDDATWLANKIATFDLTVESAKRELARESADIKQKAFKTILKNRIYHGGILAPGSGFIKNGENGKGIASRWYPQTLKRRIENINMLKTRFQFIHGDGLKYLRHNAHRTDAVFFIDPPYTAAGKKAGRRLYAINELDHEELFRVAETLQGDFLMTYDNADGVLALAKKYGFSTAIIPMKNTHHAEMTELLIGRDLRWAQQNSF
jgi:DNA adenine methylase